MEKAKWNQLLLTINAEIYEERARSKWIYIYIYIYIKLILQKVANH